MYPMCPHFSRGSLFCCPSSQLFASVHPQKLARTFHLIPPTMREITTHFEQERVRPATHDPQTSQNVPSPAEFCQKRPQHCPNTGEGVVMWLQTTPCFVHDLVQLSLLPLTFNRQQPSDPPVHHEWIPGLSSSFTLPRLPRRGLARPCSPERLFWREFRPH